MQITDWTERLPGGTLIEKGNRRFSIRVDEPSEGYLVHIARSRLTRAGLIGKSDVATLPNAELELYRLLRSEGGDAYSRYNSLLRELVSFENALDRLTSDR